MPSKHDKIQFLVKTFGPAVVGKDGLNIAVKCPSSSCSSQSKGKKKLVIRLDNDHYQCWVCDLKGRSLERLLKKYAKHNAAEYATRFLGRSLFGAEEQKDSDAIDVKIPKGFIFLATAQNIVDPDVKDTVAYARSRGISERDFWRFRLGTCTSGRNRRRLIMPSFDSEGKVNYFVARSIDEDQGLKYLNAKIPKKTVIFNEIYIDWKSELTIVEGPMDLIKCDDNATCLLGSHFAEDYALFQKIIENQTPVLLALDPDAALKSQKFAKKLSSYGIGVRMLDNRVAEDVGAMTKDEFAEAKRAAKRWTSDDRLRHLISTIGSGSIL